MKNSTQAKIKKAAWILFLISGSQLQAQQLSSPDGSLQLQFYLDSGKPFYQLEYKGKDVILPSRLGLEMDEISLTDDFTVKKYNYSHQDTLWHPVWGEYKDIRDCYNEMTVELVQQNTGTSKAASVTLCFRLYDDGLGFRYEFPAQEAMNYVTVKEELTEFNLTGNHTFYCMPGDYDTNEFPYTTAAISDIKQSMEARLNKKGYESKAPGLTVQTPLMIKSEDGLYINIHEAALVNYAAMLLNVDDSDFKLSAHLTPDKMGKKGYLQLPFHTPWRTILVSDDARDILASQLIYNLNEPCKWEDTSWIKPVKYLGVWWEMFIGTGRTWAYSDYYKAKPGITDYTRLTPNGRHAATTERVKEYIDFAAANGFDAVLAEGWNEGWEDWAAYKKERQFSFTRAYPDFDVKELQSYASSKGIQLIMHHETSSNAADYERQLDDAFRFMKDHGYHTVKTGYVGYIIPRSEYHSSQWMNNHYLHVVQRAADFQIMVNSHEAVRPTGLCRTYPNWLAQESARGGEFESMGGNDPDHTTILPFTRLKGGPMDYTPGIFEPRLSYYGGDKPSECVHTTLVKQLALYVTMPSPIQMAADLPENYQRFPDAFQFIKDVAVDWDNSWYLEAEPGDYITVARKAKNRDEWFIGAITDENSRTAIIDLSFLPKNHTYEAIIYEDGKKADWKNNPQSYQIRTIKVKSGTVLKQHLAAGGGAAIHIRIL